MMTSIDLLLALVGLGMFLVSLRFLNGLLERSVARRPKPVLDRIVATRAGTFVGGGVTTLMVQASSLTILAAMGLLGASMITLEQGYGLMLGATVGTSIKAWIFALGLDRYSPVLIGVSAAALVFVRNPVQRDKIEALLAMGFGLFGLDLLATGLTPLGTHPEFQGVVQQLNDLSWKKQFLGVCTGAVLAMAVQSSTVIVFLAIHFAMAGVLDVAGCASLVLGANVGTTFTAWRASLEYETEVRRLALAHVLVKAAGVMAAVFLLPYIHQGIVTVVASFGRGRFPGIELATLHVGFNTVNAAVFTLLAGTLLRFLRWWVPDRRVERRATIPLVVRRMLTRTPERGLDEADRHLGHLDQRTKALSDQCLEMLLEGAHPEAPAPRHAHPGPPFSEIREGLHDLLLRVGRRRLGEDQLARMREQLRFLTRCTDLNQEGAELQALLRVGMVDEGYSFPPVFLPLFTIFQARFDALWLKFHYRRPPEPGDVAALMAAVEDLDREFFRVLATDRRLSSSHLAWMYDVLEALRRLAVHLGPLCDHAPQVPTARALTQGKTVPIPAPGETARLE